MTQAFVYVGRCPKCQAALSLMSCAEEGGTLEGRRMVAEGVAEAVLHGLVVSREERNAATQEFAAPGTCKCKRPKSVLSEHAQVRVVIDPDDGEDNSANEIEPVTLSEHESRVMQSLADDDCIFDRHGLDRLAQLHQCLHPTTTS